MRNLGILLVCIVFVNLSCGDKKEKVEAESTSVKLEALHLQQEIKVLEAVTEELKAAESEIQASIEKLDNMFNEL